MRYQLDNEGYLIEVNFGCTTGMCTEYTGIVPEGYETIEEWYEDNCECVRSWKIVDGNLVYDASKDYKLQVLYEQEAYNNAHVSKKEMGMVSTEEINPYTDLFPSHQSAGGYITYLNEEFNKVGNLPTEEVNLTLHEEQKLDLIELEFIGNNFLPNIATSTTNNGITYTQNKDKTISIKGTATDRSTLNLAGTDTSVRNILTLKGIDDFFVEKMKNYYNLTGLVEEVSLEFYHYDGTDRTLIGTYNNGLINYDVDVNITQVVLVIESGTTIDTTIKPMLSLASIEHPILPMTKYLNRNLFDSELWYETLHNVKNEAMMKETVNGIEYYKFYPNAIYLKEWMGGKFKENTQYTISFKGLKYDSSNPTATGFTFQYTDGTYTYVAITSDVEQEYELTSKAGKTVKYIGLYYQTNWYALVRDIQLEEGTTATEYEPYDKRNGQYYVDGVSTQTTRSGKNLADIKSFLNNNTAWAYHSLTLKSNTSYIVSSNIPSNLNDALPFFAFNSTGSASGTVNKVYDTKPIIVTTNEDGIVKFQWRLTDTTYSYFDYVYQIEEGTQATEYEEYGVSPSPDYPSEIINTYKAGTYNVVIDNTVYTITIDDDLRSLPNGVADRLWVDVSDEHTHFEIERKVGSVVLDGSETFVNKNITDNNLLFSTNAIDSLFNTLNLTNIRSDSFTINSNLWGNDEEGICLFNMSYGLRFRTKKELLSDITTQTNAINSFKTLLSTHNTIVYYELATYTIISISEYSYNEYTYEEYKNNSTLIDLKGNTFTFEDKITIKDNQILLIKKGAIDKILDGEGNEIPVQREEIYLGDTVMPRTYTPYTHAYCHQKVYIDFKYKDPRNVDINKINLKGLILITNIETEYNFTSDDYTKVRNYIMGTEDLTDEEIELYDINGDGIVSSADYIIIKNMVDGVIPNKIIGELEINSTQSKRTIVLRDNEGKIKTSLGLNGATTPYFSCEKLTLGGIEQPQILSGTSLPEEVVNGQVFLLYDE